MTGRAAWARIARVAIVSWISDDPNRHLTRIGCMGTLRRDSLAQTPAEPPGTTALPKPSPSAVPHLKIVSLHGEPPLDPLRGQPPGGGGAAEDPAKDPANFAPGSASASVEAAAPGVSAVSGDEWSQLTRRIAEHKDRDAFARLFQHFAPRVKSYLMRTGSSEQMAEDLSQEALVTVWRKAALFDPAQAAVSTWIFTIARRLRIDAARRHRLEDTGDESYDFDRLEADQRDVGEHTDAVRLSRRIRDALGRLPAEQAQVLRLSYYDDEPHARIAAELGLPLGTVKSRIRLAVAQLRKMLDA
ncbi:RNA polymerase sigma-70 factor (ECF subfamily) [Roseateles depolymerans]|uniref:RNA polymerase sigma factor n=1 Tax=Roseateles depolymerans TaxID=76731 RepID=A0A0U2U3Z5_9BURK|nr:RNA polymerase sigma factor [Roseateles depolymerans]REG19909.1 RNA polymerase sigma-70 factor (ECF subfamily) [Roseateles depolymerans]